jgi:hypothetical protein
MHYLIKYWCPYQAWYKIIIWRNETSQLIIFPVKYRSHQLIIYQDCCMYGMFINEKVAWTLYTRRRSIVRQRYVHYWKRLERAKYINIILMENGRITLTKEKNLRLLMMKLQFSTLFFKDISNVFSANKWYKFCINILF